MSGYTGKHRKKPPRRKAGKLAAVGALALAPMAAASSASAADWDELAQCEASGDWSANTGNGFYGGLQFTSSTWAEFGGTEYASSAHEATREQQIAVAEQVLAAQGSGAWPGCTDKTAWTQGSVDTEVDVYAESNSAVTSTKADADTDDTGSYVVQDGDTLSEIAYENGVSLEAIASANAHVSDHNVIYPGQILIMP